jgi:hypothetical protein
MNSRTSLWLITILIMIIVLSACNLGATPAPAVDPGAIQTQAFNDVLTQVSSQQTQTALAVPPTPIPTNTFLPTVTLGATFEGAASITPFSFNTQQPGFTPITSPVATFGVVTTLTTKNGCNDGLYIGETHPFDKEIVKAGKEFSKAWTIQNTGTCTWDEGYSFTYLPDSSDAELHGYSITLVKNHPEDYTPPTSTQSFVVKLKGPPVAGEYQAFWKLRDDAGNFFGPLVSVWVMIE